MRLYIANSRKVEQSQNESTGEVCDILLAEHIAHIEKLKISGHDVARHDDLMGPLPLYIDGLIEPGEEVTSHMHSFDLNNGILAHVA